MTSLIKSERIIQVLQRGETDGCAQTAQPEEDHYQVLGWLPEYSLVQASSRFSVLAYSSEKTRHVAQ